MQIMFTYITYDLLMIYLWFTYDSLMIYLCFTYDLHIIYLYCLWLTYANYVYFLQLMIYLWFTYVLLMIHLLFTYYPLMIHLWFTYDYIHYLWFAFDLLMIYSWFTYDSLFPLHLAHTLWFTYDLLMIYLWFTCDLLVIYLLLLSITYDLHMIYLHYLWLISQKRSELFIDNYWLVAHFRAVRLIYHHRLPSPAPFFESKIAPLKSGFSLRMENGIVPVSIRASRPKIEVMGTTYRTCDCVQFVNYFRVAFIQPSCYYRIVSTISPIKRISNIRDLPGRRGPVYFSSTDTKARECLFSPRSAFDSTWNSSRILQNQTLSIRSSKAPCEIPGRMKTKSWRLAPRCKWPRRDALLFRVLGMPDCERVE